MFCWKCGGAMDAGVANCPTCSSPAVPPAQPVRAPSPRIEDDPAMRLLLPVGRSMWAIAAGYLGLVSVLLVFAPFAVACSILAFQDIKTNPGKLGKGRAVFGLVMGVPGTVLLVWALGFVLTRPH